MNISYISDLHLDFYIQMKAAWQRKTNAFLTTLLPDNKSEVLIVAGDLSHYNAQSIYALTFFAQHFEQIFFVMGNHDYYLVSRNHQSNYRNKSINREIELHQAIADLPNVKILANYEVAEFNGVLFAGATNWYGLNSAEEQHFFERFSNDSKLIKGFTIRQKHMEEMAAYEQLAVVDVLITHVPPIHVNSHIKNSSTLCYLNELSHIRASHCIFGHCHEQHIYEQDGTTFYMNALGYPDQKLPQKIRTFSLEEKT